MIRPIGSSMFLLLVVAGRMHGAEMWTEFRGPTGQGHTSAQSLPIEWSATENVAWKQAIPGKGWSSPVVYRDRIFLTAAVPVEEKVADEPSVKEPAANLDIDRAIDNATNKPKSKSKVTDKPTAISVPKANPNYTLRTFCLDAADGSIVWDREIFQQTAEDDARIHGKNSHASPTPVIFDNLLYVHFGHQGTACLDFDGNVKWRSQEIQYQPVHGNGGSPLLTERAVIFSCDGATEQWVVALDRRSGSLLWKAERPTEQSKKFAFSTPLLIEVGGKQQVISPGAGAVCALDVTSGEELWRCRYDGYSVIPRPVFGHGMIFISTGYDRPQVMAIRVDGAGDVTDTHVAWTQGKGAPNTPSLLLVDDEIYMVSDRGVVTCLEAKTGEIVWQERIGGNFSASPLYADGRIYLQSEEGDGTVLKAGRAFEKLGESRLGERTLASYAVDGEALLIRSDAHLFRIEKQ